MLNTDHRGEFMLEVIWPALVIPFCGTTLGAACVLFLRGTLNRGVQRAFTGFAAGVMVAASIWSLLIPAIEESGAAWGELSFVPAVIGFWVGIGFLLLLDHVTPHLHFGSSECEGPACSLPRTTMLLLAVTLHNIPEGMAVGVVYAGLLTGSGVPFGAALALAIGIAIQNFPEGAIISLPLRSAGESRWRAFVNGVLSGAVEPVGAALAIAAASFVVPVLPYFLSFAAGAMIYVVVEELIPEMSEGEHSDIGVLSFAVGFTLMMALDVALG